MLVSIKVNSRFMLLTKFIYCIFIYLYSLDIVGLDSVPFIYVVTIYILNCITIIGCNSSFFVYFDWSVLL